LFASGALFVRGPFHDGICFRGIGHAHYNLEMHYMHYTMSLPPETHGHGRTRHFRNGSEVTNEVTSLQIEIDDACGSVYLFYLDSSGNELNDLYFDTFELAAKQVEWEFGIPLIAR
jgi:hypothetical protein